MTDTRKLELGRLLLHVEEGMTDDQDYDFVACLFEFGICPISKRQRREAIDSYLDSLEEELEIPE